VSEAEQPWLTTRQFVEYWREHPLNGRAIWALVDESHRGEPGRGMSLVGLFASPPDAVAHLAEDAIGPEETARLIWRGSGTHDGFWAVYGQDSDDGSDRHYLLTDEEVEANIAAGRGCAALARASALSPDSDPYPDDGVA
jgi:hypothetical protein